MSMCCYLLTCPPAVFQRAIDTVTRATELDLEGLYGEAVTQYDAALRDFDTVVAQGTSLLRHGADVTCHATARRGDSEACGAQG